MKKESKKEGLNFFANKWLYMRIRRKRKITASQENFSHFHPNPRKIDPERRVW